MAINFDGAGVYFGAESHPRAAVWSGFTENGRKAAIAEARRQFSRALNRPMKDDEAAYVEGDKIREEYAVYEQALHLLCAGQIANASADSQAVLTGQDEVESGYMADSVAGFGTAALNWLNWSGAILLRT